MADAQKIARLADFPEFAELKIHFDEAKEDDIQALGRKTFANPAEHDALVWERKKAFYAGVEAVLRLPVNLRAKVLKESQ